MTAATFPVVAEAGGAATIAAPRADTDIDIDSGGPFGANSPISRTAVRGACPHPLMSWSPYRAGGQLRCAGADR